MPPRAGWGLLQIGQTVYAVHECHFEDADGRTCFCVRLRRSAGQVEYQLCQDRDNDLACDCPDATYRERECKHVHAVRDAYAALDRDRRLSDFLADDETVPCPECNCHDSRYCRTCDGIGEVPAKGGAA
jgi:hypothetical protein